MQTPHKRYAELARDFYQSRYRFYQSRAYAYASRWTFHLCLLGEGAAILFLLSLPDASFLGLPAPIVHWATGIFCLVGFVALLFGSIHELRFDKRWQDLTHFYEVEHPLKFEELAQQEVLHERYAPFLAETAELTPPYTWHVFGVRYAGRLNTFSVCLRLDGSSHAYMATPWLSRPAADELFAQIYSGKISPQELMERFDWVRVCTDGKDVYPDEEGM